MKKWLKRLSLPLVALVVVLAWILYFHNQWVSDHAPTWAWLQTAIGHLGQHVDEPPPEEGDPDNAKNEIPVHVAKVSVATLHRYIEGIGLVAPRPARPGQMSGSTNVASPVAGVVAKVACQIGQKVHAGDTLIQLDDRLAKSAEDQADAALVQAQASLAVLKATPRPEQVQIAQLGIDKAKAAVDFAQKNYDRQKALAAGQGTSGKSVEQAAADLASALNDLAVAQRQMDLLKASPTAEELRAEEAKVRQADAALASARMQRQMLTIPAPIDGTVMTLAVNPSESVDTTRTLVGLVALDRLMVDVDVPADQLPAAAEGLTAQIMLTSASAANDVGSALRGKVTYVDSQVEPKNGAVMIGIDLPADTTLRPGRAVRVRIIAEEHKDVLVLPREAVVLDENLDNVISIVEGEVARHHTVKAGLVEGGIIEIGPDAQVKADIDVVSEGAFGLRETQQTHVKVVK